MTNSEFSMTDFLDDQYEAKYGRSMFEEEEPSSEDIQLLLSKISPIGKMCKHTPTGMIGKITKELNSFDPPQFGVYWTPGGAYAKFVQGHGVLPFWNDKSTIEIL